MISAALIALAALFNSLMDAVENENFYESIFRGSNVRWWYKRESWKYAKKIFGWKADAWHIFKSSMIICMCLAIVLYKPVFGWWDFLMYGVIWNIVFVFFYHKVFRIK